MATGKTARPGEPWPRRRWRPDRRQVRRAGRRGRRRAAHGQRPRHDHGGGLPAGGSRWWGRGARSGGVSREGFPHLGPLGATTGRARSSRTTPPSVIAKFRPAGEDGEQPDTTRVFW